MRSDIVPGGTFPDYELPDHENVARKLSEIQGDDPLVLTLARGHYCPKEHQQHLELAGIVRPYRAGEYPNFVEEPADASGFFEAAVWDRLRDVKRRYDPADLFAGNHHVPPATAADH